MKKIGLLLLVVGVVGAATIPLTVRNENVATVLDALYYLQGKSIEITIPDGDRTSVTYTSPVFRDPNLAPDETKAQYAERFVYQLLRATVIAGQRHQNRVNKRVYLESFVDVDANVPSDL